MYVIDQVTRQTKEIKEMLIREKGFDWKRQKIHWKLDIQKLNKFAPIL